MVTGGNAVFKKSAGLIGSGVPVALAPVVGLIEGVSLVLRPVTLALRLTANMVAGHVIIRLLMMGLIGSSAVLSLLMLPCVVGIYLVEFAVSVLQAYVFVLLLRLYVRE